MLPVIQDSLYHYEQCPCIVPGYTNSLKPVGSVAEWSKALVLGTSHFDGVGSNPTAAKYFLFFLYIHEQYHLYYFYCSRLAFIIILYCLFVDLYLVVKLV